MPRGALAVKLVKRAFKRASLQMTSIVERTLSTLADPRVVATCVVVLSTVLALLLRLVPMRWGIYLNEFDPFYEYYVAEKLLKEGRGDVLKGLAWWFSWWFNRGEKDTLFWAPHGRDVRASSQLGAPLFSAAIYSILRALGFNVDLYTVHAFIPAVGAATTSLFIYLLARELWGSSAGVISSILMTCSWPFIYRTNLGAKHEGIAMPFLLLSLTLLIQAARRGSMLRGFLAGVAMGFVVLAWGGFLYPWNLTSLAVLLWLLLHPASRDLAKAFIPFILTVNAVIATLPRFGPGMAFTSPAAAIPLLATALSVAVLFRIRIPRGPLHMERRRVVVMAVAVVALLAIAWFTGLLTRLPGRIFAILVPVWREVGITTVAEHAVPTWSSMYRDYGLLIPLSAYGALIIGLNYRRKFENLFVLLLWASAAYATASMARLTLLFAPAVSLLAAYGMADILERVAAPLLNEKRRGTRAQKGVEALSPLLTLVVVVVVAALPLSALARYDAVVATHHPALILSSSIPVIDYNYQYTDWLSALEWIKANVPEGSVIATWWDYGYWISVNTKRNTTCDNATIDTRRIQEIARAFLSSEEEALRIFKSINVSYVVIFEPFIGAEVPWLGSAYLSPAFGGLGGDFAKSYQMARWIGEDPSKYVCTGAIRVGGYNYPVLVPCDTPKARNATLYHLLFTRTAKRRFFIFERLPFYGVPLQDYQGPTPEIPQPKYFRLVFTSKPNEWVLVFRVEYPKTP